MVKRVDIAKAYIKVIYHLAKLIVNKKVYFYCRLKEFKRNIITKNNTYTSWS